MNNKAITIINELEKLYPDATCFLNHSNTYELLVAVILSAQTTDLKVNKVTPTLFKKYPNIKSLAKAKIDDVKEIIKSIGLANNKANNIINMANEVETRFNGIIPNNREDLVTLPGVGRKTANVVLANSFNVPTFAVDTHVYRVSYRLGIRKVDDDVLTCELKLNKYFDKSYWIKLHHQFILFGRNICESRKPKCEICPLKKYCKKK